MAMNRKEEDDDDNTVPQAIPLPSSANLQTHSVRGTNFE